MTDIVNAETRSRMMSGIRGKNTKPEMLVRSQLHKRGFRFRLHDRKLPGKPDIIMKKYKAVIFIHGCFWHRHECHLFKWPKTRSEYWRKKINGNVNNDQKVIKNLMESGWRICVIWECSIKGANKDINGILKMIIDWLENEETLLEVSG